MWELDVYVARAAECQQKAKGAKNEEQKQSWLAMAGAWLFIPAGMDCRKRKQFSERTKTQNRQLAR
jgi:hypothetical protein